MQNNATIGRYPTIGKFLSQFTDLSASGPAVSAISTASVTQAVPISPVAAPEPVAAPDLDLLDNLVTQAVLNSSQQTDSSMSADQQFAQPARQKEMLLTTEPAAAEIVDVVSTEVLQTALEASECLSVPENAEMQELSAELHEVSKETKEQREQAEIKEKQVAIDELSKTIATPVSVGNQPVVVLPITVKSKEEARFKSPKYSVVWLWEWCKKITKIFQGSVIYKEEVDSTN